MQRWRLQNMQHVKQNSSQLQLPRLPLMRLRQQRLLDLVLSILRHQY